MIILFRKKRLILFTLLLFVIIMIVIFLGIRLFNNETSIVMGGFLEKQSLCRAYNDAEVFSTLKNTSNADEKYFRPSKLPSLNVSTVTSEFFFDYWDKKPKDIVVPEILMSTPEATITNYFNIIKHGENLTEAKSGGCGSVGDSKLPFYITYNFFSRKYMESVSFDEYLKSHEGIGHINLIKLHKIPIESEKLNYLRYFIEIETIEGSNKGVTYFAYYYGYVYLTLEKNRYKIAYINYFGEDFLCAPYHGWQHLAEANVDIRYGTWCGLVKERYPTEQDGYVKKIYFNGTDNKDYLIVFFELTNGTDIEIAQYIKDSRGNWNLTRLNPNRCIEDSIND